ncbi:MAG: dUTPase [Bacillales bacterium]|jgi:dUTP pyrophosphatase|nr:dUTPase [Bacillales bacterium]
MKRGFEIYNKDIKSLKPTRQTKCSAGYDFYLPTDIIIKPYEIIQIPSNVKAYMQDDEVLFLFIRSSMGIKNGLSLVNKVGVIDADYKDFEISFTIRNNTDKVVNLSKDTRVVQGIFTKYLLSDDDHVETIRKGGIGSTK